MSPTIEAPAQEEVELTEAQIRTKEIREARKEVAKLPWMTFRLKPGAGSHENRDKDGKSRWYHSRDGLPILSQQNLADTWPEKFERIDGHVSDQNPFLNVPAPGELPEDFQKRMERLKMQAKVDNAVAEAAKAGVPATNNLPAPLPKSQAPNFDNMTVQQVKKWAADNEIDLLPDVLRSNDKGAVVKAVRSALM